ncbi:MAG: CoA transferase [Planctomycetota bacterium]|nr:MAG: CoA transferase [Planctomycetota bacterium]
MGSEATDNEAALPLSGLRVLDLTQLLPGPYASLVLADFGAEVVKLEARGIGDPARMLPPFVPDGRHGVVFEALNRNKRSVAIDLKSEGGRELLARLLERADVLLEGFRPGVLARLGFGLEELARRYPRLIVCSVTGYGQRGPLASRAGHDIDYLAVSGALSLIGERDGPPVLPAFQIADAAGAWQAVTGILLALRARERTGRGQHVDVSLTDAAFALMPMQLAQAAAGEPVRRGRGPLGGEHPGYRVYRTADGEAIAVGALEPKFWERVCRAIGREDLVGLSAALYGGLPPHELERAHAELEALFAGRTRAAWQAVFEAIDACVEPVRELDEAIESEHVEQRGLLVESAGARVPLPGPRLSETPARARRAAPAHGADTEELLAELGYSPEQRARLRREGVVD